MRLTARSEYGLLALVEIAAGGEQPSSARELAERWGMPLKFLEQLLSALKRAGVVRSTRGARGGYVLTRPAEEISVLDAVEALEGPLAPSVCAQEGEGCAQSSRCAAGTIWSRVSDAVRDVLASVTLADLATDQLRLDALVPASSTKE